jgi:hypothetical protein
MRHPRSMTRTKTLVVAASLTLLVACAGSGGMRPADVAVYHVAPPRAYEFVGTVRTESTAPTRNEALADLRERAAAVGANAVIVSDRSGSTGPLHGVAIRLQR